MFEFSWVRGMREEIEEIIICFIFIFHFLGVVLFSARVTSSHYYMTGFSIRKQMRVKTEATFSSATNKSYPR